MEITIRIDGASSTPSMQTSAGIHESAMQSVVPQAATAPAAGYPLPEIIAKATALGAINAGAAPDPSSPSSPHAAAWLGAPAPSAAMSAVTAGPPPAHVFSSEGGGPS